jgi:hypothetical protein
MVFSDTSTRQGLIQDAEDLTGLGATGISGVAAKLQTFTRYINQRYFEVAGFIITAEVSIERPAGWDEYDKKGLGELRQSGYDGVKYSTDKDFENIGESWNYVIYNKEIIKKK